MSYDSPGNALLISSNFEVFQYTLICAINTPKQIYSGRIRLEHTIEQLNCPSYKPALAKKIGRISLILRGMH